MGTDQRFGLIIGGRAVQEVQVVTQLLVRLEEYPMLYDLVFE